MDVECLIRKVQEIVIDLFGFIGPCQEMDINRKFKKAIHSNRLMYFSCGGGVVPDSKYFP